LGLHGRRRSGPSVRKHGLPVVICASALVTDGRAATHHLVYDVSAACDVTGALLSPILSCGDPPPPGA